MRTVTPEFDGTWFVVLEDRIVEAGTLRELQRKVGSDYHLEGYHPQGYARKAEPLWPQSRPLPPPVAPPILQEAVVDQQPARAATAAPHAPEPNEVKVPEPAPVRLADAQATPITKMTKQVYDHDKILDLWNEGKTGPEIGRILAMPNWKRIGDIIAAARKRGDPRAHARKGR
jgi:hypothetical protein